MESSRLRRALKNRDHYFIIGLEDRRPVGYLSAFRFPAVGENECLVYLYDVIVDESRRRRRIASAMIEELKRYCESDGVDRIWVGTTSDNVPARRTFEGTGARKVRESYIEYVYDVRLTLATESLWEPEPG